MTTLLETTRQFDTRRADRAAAAAPERAMSSSSYRVRLAESHADVRAAQMLRFGVFNLELNEGLEESYFTCLDVDPFDEVCDHILVEDTLTGDTVGTYRLQTGRNAAVRRGYYSEQEFVFAPYERLRGELIELGRACVHRQHRNLAVLRLLWREIAAYARRAGARYLIGCSSVNSQDPAAGAALFSYFARRCLVDEELRTVPQPAYATPVDPPAESVPEVPKLLAAYLALGAKIGGPPALDREFKTIDFLTFLDLDTLPPRAVQRYLS